MDTQLLNMPKEELIALLTAAKQEAGKEKQKAEAEKQKAETERQKVEAEKRNAEAARQETIRLEHLANDLRFQIEQLKRLLFGAKRERFVAQDNPAQLSLALEVDVQEQTEAVEEQITYSRKQATKIPHPGRHPFPSHLPVEEIYLEPQEDTTGMTCIGQEITEELDLHPQRLFVRRFIRPKYVKPGEGDSSPGVILIAPAPNRALPKCQAAPGLLAQILLDKFVYHLPIYRQRERFKQDQVNIPASTIDSWQRLGAHLLEPLYACLKSRVLQPGYLQVDETPIRVLDKNKKGESHRGYHWVYHRPKEKVVLFDYRKGRGREGPAELLQHFKGFIQTDGYTVYEQFGQRKDIQLIYCWAHARRYFEKALAENHQGAETVLLKIQQLYDVERRARDSQLDALQTHALRLDKSLPVLNALGQWLAQNNKLFLPKSLMGTACAYTIKRWDGLLAYLFDGQLQIDNNPIENSIRPNALGRKNYLFCGSHEGAQRAAMFYSFTGTCKLNGVNPLDWLNYVITNIADHPINRIHELLPQYFIKKEGYSL